MTEQSMSIERLTRELVFLLHVMKTTAATPTLENCPETLEYYAGKVEDAINETGAGFLTGLPVWLRAVADAWKKTTNHKEPAAVCANLVSRWQGNPGQPLLNELDRLRRLEAAVKDDGLAESADEYECCRRCDGNGSVYADGKAHCYSEHAATMPCPDCGGEGRIKMDAVANYRAALLTTMKGE